MTPDKINLYKCQCSAPGMCSVFKRLMGTDPPDWQWCQNATKADREHFHKIVSRKTPSYLENLVEEYSETELHTKWFSLYVLIKEKGFHDCIEANKYQEQKFLKMIGKLDNHIKNNGFDNLQILCLGHKEEQFENFVDKPFLKKINLNKIDAGIYSDNKWAETRAFLSSKELFRENTEYKGLVTASWNQKYEPFDIQTFDLWNSAHLLVNSNPEDKIVLCADIFCPCCWLYDLNSPSILSHFFGKYSLTAGKKLLSILDLELDKHVRVPFGNQIIAHKSIIEEYQKFLLENEVLDKVDFFIQNHNNKIIKKNDVISKYYHHTRINAYIMEMVSCFWFAKQDYLYYPNVRRKLDWYNPVQVKQRIKKWNMTS